MHSAELPRKITTSRISFSVPTLHAGGLRVEVVMFDYTEPVPIADIYADGVADVELLPGGNVRLIFFVWERGQRVVVAKVVRPVGSVLGTLPALIARKALIEAPPLLLN